MVEPFFRKLIGFNLTSFSKGYSLVDGRASESGVVRSPYKGNTMFNAMTLHIESLLFKTFQ